MNEPFHHLERLLGVPTARLLAIKELDYCGLQHVGLAALAALPQLEALELRARGDLGLLSALPALRRLTLHATWRGERASLARLDLPALEELTLRSHRDLADLPALPSLRKLTLDGDVHCETLRPQPALRVLALQDCAARSLAPLLAFPSLVRLELERWSGPASGLKTVASLPKLEELSLKGAILADLTPLLGARGLRVLDLRVTGIRDLAPLAELPLLEVLYLPDGADLSTLPHLPRLRDLAVRGAGAHLERVGAQSALRRLVASAGGVSSLEALAGLTELETLDISRNPGLTDLRPLSRLARLRSLDLALTGVRALGPLARLSSLERLALEGLPLEGLSPLAGLSSLQVLGLHRSQVESLEPLEGLEQLQTLDLSVQGSLPEGSLRHLRGMEGLSHLRLPDGADGPTVASLPALPALETLELPSSGLVELRSIGARPGLRRLNLRFSEGLRDLSGVEVLPGLTHLGLQQTAVHELMPVVRLEALEELDVSACPITDLRPLLLSTSLSLVVVRGVPDPQGVLPHLRRTRPLCRVVGDGGL